MKYTPIANLRQYLMLALFVVLPTLAVDASGADMNALDKSLPPIDQNTPKVLKTASFGLG